LGALAAGFTVFFPIGGWFFFFNYGRGKALTYYCCTVPPLVTKFQSLSKDKRGRCTPLGYGAAVFPVLDRAVIYVVIPGSVL
jgi:hypothetical protein